LQEDDLKIAEWLKQSEKNRAENLMIVDMVRSDLGKIAEIGTIQTDLFKIDRYPSVWQMISDVSAISKAGLIEIFTALFPSASITGAPKVRTMEIIDELENEPREVYTGAIGIIKPDGDMQFNVGIRTALIDLKTHHIEYGVGGGITWDSSVDDEYEETIHKSLIITSDYKQFSLFETMCWTKDEGIFLIEYHMKRLSDSAEYFGFTFNLESLQNKLSKLDITENKAVIRVELDKFGTIKIAVKKYPDKKSDKGKVGLSKIAISSKNRMLYHKTTDRNIYNNARKMNPEYDDMIFINENGEVTESTIANVVIEKNGYYFTPPVKCGLLGGTFRKFLLDESKIVEKIITVDELLMADNIYLINSVRGWILIDVIPAEDNPPV